MQGMAGSRLPWGLSAALRHKQTYEKSSHSHVFPPNIFFSVYQHIFSKKYQKHQNPFFMRNSRVIPPEDFLSEPPALIPSSAAVPCMGGPAYRSFSTYFPIISVSRLTGSPFLRSCSTVCATVWGIAEIEKPVRSTLATVRLIPSIVMEPFSTI